MMAAPAQPLDSSKRLTVALDSLDAIEPAAGPVDSTWSIRVLHFDLPLEGTPTLPFAHEHSVLFWRGWQSCHQPGPVLLLHFDLRQRSLGDVW